MKMAHVDYIVNMCFAPNMDKNTRRWRRCNWFIGCILATSHWAYNALGFFIFMITHTILFYVYSFYVIGAHFIGMQ